MNKFERVTEGVKRGELVCIMAGSGVGKSIFNNEGQKPNDGK